MNKAEVAMLVRAIKANYPGFDSSSENIDRLTGLLRDFPYEVALGNVRQHILTERFPPNVAEIRGRLGEQLERERMREATEQHFENLEAWSAAAKPPPAGYWEEVKRRIRGEADA